MVDDPADYFWSSYQSNALGRSIKLRAAHPEYLQLGKTEAERLAAYRDLFRYEISGNRLKELRDSLNKGLVYGSERFKDEIEFNLQRHVRPEKAGRKPKEMLL